MKHSCASDAYRRQAGKPQKGASKCTKTQILHVKIWKVKN